jgi:drug/metabolite transporter (DMT)-like permease
VGWQVGVAVALGSAFVANLGSLWRQRGAEAAPVVDMRHPLRSAVGLFRSKWWTIGYAAAFVAWLLHIAALGIAPLSIVQATLAAGFIFLAVLAERFFGFELRKREWVGIGLAAAGLAFLALSAGDVDGKQSDYELAAILGFEGGLVGLGAFLLVSARRSEDGSDRNGVLLGAGAGILFTVTHVAIKALTKDFDGPLALVSVWTPVVVAGGVIAFFASARSLQIGPAVPVIAITSIAGNATSIAAGVVVFGDPLGEGAMAAARIAAFLTVVIVAGLLPGPIHEAGERKRRVSRAGGRAGAPAGA